MIKPTTNQMIPLFRIEKLLCSYNNNSTALSIEHLEIPRAKMIAILGRSGAGKSTILESLGLMNKTFNHTSDILFNDMNGNEISFKTLWSKNDKKDIEHIRNKHFSFIFQETNLMPNFTAYENVCLSQMIQGTSYNESFAKAKKIMDKIGLADIDQFKKANELSGGQKQRLAFVRAIAPEYTVLFGDEPTGNLDEKTSEDLMRLIKEDVQQKNVTAIIVTHNVRLSLRFADIIMVITKEKSVGRLELKNIFYSTHEKHAINWMNHENKMILDIEEHLKLLL